MMRKVSRRAAIALISAFTAIGALSASATTYSAYYTDRALPGVSISGEGVTGLTAEEITARIQERFDNALITLNIDGTQRTATYADLGFSIDIPQAVHAALAPNASFSQQISTPFTGADIPLTHTFDDEIYQAFTSTLLPDDAVHATDASVTFDKNSATFTVTPGHAGQHIDTAELKNSLEQALPLLQTLSLDLHISTEDPQISTESAKKAAQTAQTFITTEITLSDGIDTFSPSLEEKARWINLNTDSSGYTTPTVNSEALSSWVKDTAQATNVDPVPGVNNVNSRGDVVSVHDAGTTGWTANNVEEVTAQVDKAFRTHTDYSGSFDYDQKNPEMTTRLIADGAGAHIYAATPGEKWIDLNLSDATVTAYEGATVVRGPILMVPGAPETPTVTGTFRVWHQNPLQTMRGLNADGTKYETPNVPWATYFFQDYAFHGAPWRSSFGWSGPGGSHGCINMPVNEAEWIYDWASIGTVVVSHY